MSLRYKGVPQRGQNIQADELIELCFCRFIAVGVPLDGRECSLHGTRAFGCDCCQGCTNYRPNRVKEFPTHWPLCVCGHIAQEHNEGVS